MVVLKFNKNYYLPGYQCKYGTIAIQNVVSGFMNSFLHDIIIKCNSLFE